MDEIERLKDALRTAYQLAWNIEQGSHEAGTRVRAREIKRVTMAVLQETNEEFQVRKASGKLFDPSAQVSENAATGPSLTHE